MTPKKHNKLIALVMGVSCVFLFSFLFVPLFQNIEGFASPTEIATNATEEAEEAQKKAAAATATASATSSAATRKSASTKAEATTKSAATTKTENNRINRINRNNRKLITIGDIDNYYKLKKITDTAGDEKLKELQA